jgi:hypothetical protein
MWSVYIKIKVFRVAMVKETGFNSNWVFLSNYFSCSLLLVFILAFYADRLHFYKSTVKLEPINLCVLSRDYKVFGYVVNIRCLKDMTDSYNQ